MNANQEILKTLIKSVAERVIEHTDELSELDRAIGDGDHGLNMKRGFEQVLVKLEETAVGPVPDVLKSVGMILVTKVGGASGPLYGTLFMTLGKTLPAENVRGADVVHAFGAAIEAVKARGRSEQGQKTMLDVLVPVHEALGQDMDGRISELRPLAAQAAEATIPMLALKGRASFLGERSIGHMDPGARSCALMVDAICEVLESQR